MLTAGSKFMLQLAAAQEEYRLALSNDGEKYAETVPLMREIGLLGALDEILRMSTRSTTMLQRRAAGALLAWYRMLPATAQAQVGPFEMPTQLRPRQTVARPIEATIEDTKAILVAQCRERKQRRSTGRKDSNEI